MTESQIEARLVRMVSERRGLCYKFVSPGNPGVPDRIVLTPDGRIYFIELKTEVGSLQRIQEYQIGALRVLKGLNAVKAFVDEVLPI